MRASVLQLSRTSRDIHDIETWARQARYGALVKRCSSDGIRNVLFAHHEDDQYENIILRLSKQGRNKLGMPASGRLPHSLDHFGPHHDLDPAWIRPANDTIECFGVRGVANMQMNTRRPLLGFPKQRLIATCKAFDIPWIEDESNQDHMMTERNAVRHIVAKYKLPAALSKRSLFHLDNEVKQRNLHLQHVANSLFELTHVELDLRTASAIITMPKLEDVEQHFTELVEASSSLSIESLPRAIGMYLGHICQLIHKPRQLVGPEDIALLFAEQAKRKRFTHDEVLFHPLPDGRWQISPKKPPTGRLARRLLQWALRFQYVDPAGKYTVPTFRSLDEHWWVNVSNPSPMQETVVTYLKPSHLKNLEARLASGDIILKDVNDPLGSPRDLFLILKSLGQHPLRWWLPVILIRSQAEEKIIDGLSVSERALRIAFAQDTDEQVLAFPTLNLRVHPKKKGAAPWWIQNLRWEVWYKHLDGLEGRMGESIVMPMSMEARGLKEVKAWKRR